MRNSKTKKSFASSGGGGTGILAPLKDHEELVTSVPNVRIPKKEDPHNPSPLVGN